MKNFLLLIFSLITGVQTDPHLKACRGGWIQFTCKYPQTDEVYDSFSVVKGKQKIQSEKKDEWEKKDRIYLYHDSKNKNVKVTIKELQGKDFTEKYRCDFNEHLSDELQLEKAESCQDGVSQTAYRSAQTSISCLSGGNRDMFFCRDDGPICEDISSNGTFTVSASSSSFSMSISAVSSQHAGVYWCGLGAAGGRYRAALRRITLEVKDITNFTKSPAVGQNFTYWCRANKQQPTIFICKGEDPSRCEPVVSSDQRHNRKFIMTEDKERTRFNITVINVTAEDAGTYWCGAETREKTGRNQFFHRFTMTVTPPAAADAPLLLPVMIVCISVFLLLLIFILVYKRHSKRKRNAAAAQQKEDFIPDQPQSHEPEPPSASLHYSTITFDRPCGDKRSIGSSTCEYSAVRNQTAGAPPGPEEP